MFTDSHSLYRKVDLFKDVTRESVNALNSSGNYAFTPLMPVAHINQPLILCKPKPLTAGRCLYENMIVLRFCCRCRWHCRLLKFNSILYAGILIRFLHLNLNINWHVPTFANNQDTLAGEKGSKVRKLKLREPEEQRGARVWVIILNTSWGGRRSLGCQGGFLNTFMCFGNSCGISLSPGGSSTLRLESVFNCSSFRWVFSKEAFNRISPWITVEN